jgi:hypothetical protein
MDERCRLKRQIPERFVPLVEPNDFGQRLELLPAAIGQGGRRLGSTLIRCPEREAEFRSSPLYD